MSETDTEKSSAAPFVPWNTFKTFIRADLKEKVVPPKIDSSLFSQKSGTDARLLKSALRFHGLIQGPNNETTDRLRALVAAYGTSDWEAHIKELLRNYEPILRGVNRAEGTQKELDDAFRDRGDVTGSTLRKAVRLYVAMATEAGEKLSPHFKALRGLSDAAEPSQPSPPTANNGSQKSRVKRKVKHSAPSDESELPPDGVDVITPLPNVAFRVWLPRVISQAELDFAMKYLRDYIKLKRPKGQGG